VGAPPAAHGTEYFKLADLLLRKSDDDEDLAVAQIPNRKEAAPDALVVGECSDIVALARRRGGVKSSGWMSGIAAGGGGE